MNWAGHYDINNGVLDRSTLLVASDETQFGQWAMLETQIKFAVQVAGVIANWLWPLDSGRCSKHVKMIRKTFFLNFLFKVSNLNWSTVQMAFGQIQLTNVALTHTPRFNPVAIRQSRDLERFSLKSFQTA